jgi:1-acyl-sn-glycerol-3-phosphate acyltransferase
MAAHVTYGVAICALLFPFVDELRRQRVIRCWSATILSIMRVRLHVIAPPTGAAARDVVVDALRAGDHRGERGAMVVLNHLSWLDIFVVHAVRPAHFVAKSEITSWPLLGFLVASAGTIFVERGKRHAVRDVNHRVTTLLAEGQLVALFPEGTTGDGERLLAFHANLIQPALDARVPIVVGGLRYRDVEGGPTTATLFTGEITMFESLLRIARRGPLIAELHLLDVVDETDTTRHEVARRARATIAQALGFDDEAREAREGLSTMIVVPGINPARGSAGTRLETLPDPRDELL